MEYMSYKDLDIYKKAHELAIEIHAMSLSLPQFEMYEEGRQIRKSSKSIKSNIVEGFGRRRYKQDFIRFLTIALASNDETIDHLVTLFATGSMEDAERFKYFQEEYDHLGRMITNFIKSVIKRHQLPGKSKNEDRESSIEDQDTV